MTPGPGARILMGCATAVVAAAVITGIVLLGPPGAQRAKRLDEVRITDLQNIEGLIANFTRVHKTLPGDIATLAREPGYFIRRNDPETGVPYEYEVLGPDTYRLCATFKTATSNETNPNLFEQRINTTWAHGVGRQCFSRHANAVRGADTGP